MVKRAFVLGMLIPTALQVGSALGARAVSRAQDADDVPQRTVKVRDAADGRFWGLPLTDSVRVPEVDADR